MPADFDSYFRALARSAATKDTTEHSDRSALQVLLQQAADDAEPGAHVLHEPKATGGVGRPDFKITRAARVCGYVEVKTIDENLSKVLKSDQIKRYRTLSDNILLTDYLDFIWIKGDGETERHRLAHSEDLSARKLKLSPQAVEGVRKLMRGFLSTTPARIGRGPDLAIALAHRAKLLREFLTEELLRQEKAKSKGRLHALFDVFRKQVFHELATADFADAFAQMLTYGLFLARLNAGANETVTLNNVRQHIPGSFALIRELVRFLEDLNEPEYKGAGWVVDEILSIVNGIDLTAIHNDLSFRARRAISRKVRAGDEEEHRLFERDPFIYFYEDFLKAYDPAMRKSRGVYYTPPPVVNFIVRAVDDILKDSFGIRDGLADNKRVTVLDFACGTGTFLLEVFERIFENIGGADSGKADAIVREHITTNLFGFEYMIAPYTVAHLKLSQYLKDKGHPLKERERLQVFLTNTLDPIEPQMNAFVPELSREVEAAQAVKDRDILVIVGNPPYAGHSKNPSKRSIKETITTRKIRGKDIKLATPKTVTKIVNTFAGDLIEPYRFIEGVPLGEANPKWLNDDYVKFLAFAQHKMKSVAQGIVGVITNHSWLDNPTFRGLRWSLMQTFDQLYVLDLHGSTKPKEPSPEGSKNENVFDIQKGVSVSIFVKQPGLEKGIRFAELWGDRLDKYEACAGAGLKNFAWETVDFFSPYFMCRSINWEGWDTYSAGWSVADSLNPDRLKRQIFAVNVLGFQTHRDNFAIAFNKSEIERRIRDMRDTSLSDEAIAETYVLKTGGGWSVKGAREAVQKLSIRQISEKMLDCAFRPFDDRCSFFSLELIDRPRRELLDHAANRKNLHLLISRQIGIESWRHAFVTPLPAESCCVSDGSTEQNYCFPAKLFTSEGERENLSPDFRAFLDARYSHHYTPEEILGYIYAVLHAPTYRRRYTEFLRIDFPRIPFPENSESVDELSMLGWALVQAHLLRDLPHRDLAKFHGKGDRTVEFVRYATADQSVAINGTQSFAPVPKNVWEFFIGGYQVLDKYLKSRKGRVLSLDEINHVSAVADSLAFTVDQMAKIDTAYLATFPDS
jgi:hypothetical protein